jgi:hypothetical protein
VPVTLKSYLSEQIARVDLAIAEEADCPLPDIQRLNRLRLYQQRLRSEGSAFISRLREQESVSGGGSKAS